MMMMKFQAESVDSSLLAIIASKVDENKWGEENVRAPSTSGEANAEGSRRRALRANDKYANQLCDTIYRDNGPTIELTNERKLAKLTKDPESCLRRLEQKPLEDFSRVFRRVVRGFDYSMNELHIPAYVGCATWS